MCENRPLAVALQRQTPNEPPVGDQNRDAGTHALGAGSSVAGFASQSVKSAPMTQELVRTRPLRPVPFARAMLFVPHFFQGSPLWTSVLSVRPCWHLLTSWAAWRCLTPITAEFSPVIFYATSREHGVPARYAMEAWRGMRRARRGAWLPKQGYTARARRPRWQRLRRDWSASGTLFEAWFGTTACLRRWGVPPQARNCIVIHHEW